MESIFPEDVIESIEDDVRELVRSFIPSESNSENVKSCVEFVMSNILCQKHSIPSETRTRELLDTFVSRYNCEGFPKWAQMFEDHVNYCLETPPNDCKSQKVKWNVLECLVQLSKDVFKTETLMNLESRLKACDDISFPEEVFDPEEEKIDWHAYLQEGSEKYRLPSDNSDEDNDDTMEETIMEESTEGTQLSEPTIVPGNEFFDPSPRDAIIVMDQNMILEKVMKDSVEARQWLLDNVQTMWWKGEPRRVNVDGHPTSSFGLRWEERIHPKNSQFLEEYKIIRELLWVFVLDDEKVRNERIEYLRERVTLPRLIQTTTSSIVDDILQSAIKYFHLKTFYQELLSSENVLEVAFSFRAYAYVLRNLCLTVLQKAVDEENIVREKETTYTLQMLHSAFQPYLDDINFFYEVHNDCISETWRESESWLCIVRLLSTVFDKLQETTSARNIRILLRIFFKTFEVYANMIDGWLTENKLFDWRNEFFIRKDESGIGYTAFPANSETGREEINITPFFTRISKCLLNCSQNVEFLYKLNKMQRVTSEILENGSLIDCIIREFQERLYQPSETCLDINNSRIESERDADVKPIFKSCEVPQELFENMFLIQAYSDAFQIKHSAKEKGSRFRHRPDEDDWEKNANIAVLNLLPVTYALEQAICMSIEKREATIAKFFKLAIVDDYKLFDHVRTMTGLLQIDTRPFCAEVNSRMEKKTWRGIHALQILLCDCVRSSELPFGNLVHFVHDKDSVVVSNRLTTVNVFEIIKSVDSITLQYSTEWPMSKIFTDDIVRSVYDPVFKLVLKLNIVFYSVTRLRFSDLPNNREWMHKLRKMQVFRHWVTLLLQKLRSYVMLIASQYLGDKLIESVADINNFAGLQESYLTYLNEVKPKCLIDPKMLEYLNRALERVWRVCDDVRDLWTKATLPHFSEQDVARSVELYVQCVWYLSEILKKFSNEKRKDHPLYDLWSDVQRMVEVHERSIPEDLSFKSSQSTLI